MHIKKGKKMGDLESQAKKSVLEDLRDTAKKAMSGKLSGLKKVEVQAKNEEGLKEGLEKAKELVDTDVSPAEQEMEADDKSYEDCSAEELEEKIKMLQALKEKKLQVQE
jgi:hypothetical protein